MTNKKYSLKINGTDELTYTVVKTKRKTLGISINDKGQVKVSAPLELSELQIKEMVEKKAAWISQKLKEIDEKISPILSRKFISGEQFLYLGKWYALKIVRQKNATPGISFKNENLIASITSGLEKEKEKELIKEMLSKWYKESFLDIVKERIEKYSPELKVVPAKVVIKNQKTRWGSCSTKGNLNLNWRLVMAPMEIIDYVVVHELSHLRIMNHSQEFWALVESILPNYKENRKWLKENGYKLTL